MRHGIAASIASKKRRQEAMNKSKKYMQADEESQQKEQDNIQLLQKKVFTISFYPIITWTFGIAIIILGIYFFSVIVTQNSEANIKGFTQGYWWQYFICVCVVLFGLCIMFVKNIQKIVIDKEKGLILIRKRNIICLLKELQKPINTFQDVYIIKKGYQTKFSKAIHYTLSMSFSDQHERVSSLEFTSLEKAKRRFIQIRKFLGLATDEQNIGVVDESN
ncbi:hypothetical protein ABPG72_003646 [Tetrahymena utriculariae]